jgi:phosphoesterase RecJ-like protein
VALDWQPLCELIRSAQRFVLTSHVRPDGDALGSELGLARILDAMGKHVRIINPSATPNHLAFLDAEKRVLKIGENVSRQEAQDCDVHLVVDTSSWQQLDGLRPVLESTAAKKAVIDHHVSSDDLGAMEFKDVTASATGVLIAELADALGVTPAPAAASALFCAIATDTGWFRFPNADRRTYERAATLIDQGARPSLLYRELYERSSLARLKLHSLVLERVRSEAGGRIAHTFVLRKDFEATGTHPSDTEDLVNVSLTVEGVECAFILVEQPSGMMKVSLRSRSDVDVARIAETFGGGGHRQASGAMVPGPLANAQQKVIESLTQALPDLELPPHSQPT